LAASLAAGALDVWPDDDEALVEAVAKVWGVRKG